VPDPLPVSGALDSPDFVVKVGGAPLERVDRDRVLRLDVHEEVGKLARASVLVRNWDDQRNAVLYSDNDTFGPGKPVELQVGYGSDLTTVFDGVVTGLRPIFRSGREPLLEVICRCRGVLLCGARRTRVLADSSDADLANAIAGDYGLTADAGSGASQPFVVQADATDWDTLSARARALGYALYVRGTSLVFKPPSWGGQAAATLVWAQNLVEVELEQEVGLRADQVTDAAWDPETVAATDSEAGAGASPVPHGARADVAAAVGDAGFQQRADREATPAALGPDELALRASATVDRGALMHVSGQGRAIGIPALRADGLLELSGCGRRFDGTHYVTAVRHTIDAQKGYTTEFQLGLPAPLTPPAATQPSPLQLAIAVVDDIDDPNGWGRVKVRFPWLDDQVEAVWARLAVPAAGKDRGFFFIPEVGDEVVVGLLGGDVRHPVVLGSLWNGTDAPPETLDASTNAVRAIVSRAGHKLTFDDSDGAEKVVVTSAAEQKLTIDDTSGSESVVLADKSGNKLTLDSKGITLEAASGADITLKASGGKVAIDAAQLEGKASGTGKIESSGTLDIKASATLGLKGALVNIN
jgi:Rhs element Vgr protein